jgi:hypothetical protein
LNGQPANVPCELRRSFVVPKSGTPQDDMPGVCAVSAQLQLAGSASFFASC